MTLQIQQILPTYFEAEKTQQSEIWGKNLQFNKGELIKIVAPSGSGKDFVDAFSLWNAT